MNPDAINDRCFSCGGLVPRVDGPTHRYMESSPGCWHVYGEVLSREYSDRSFGALHRLTVDCYAVQHPGRPSAQAIQSVCVHLISLCLVIERRIDPGYATRAIRTAVRKKERFVWLTPPSSLGAITVADVQAVLPPPSTRCAYRPGRRVRGLLGRCITGRFTDGWTAMDERTAQALQQMRPAPCPGAARPSQLNADGQAFCP